MPSKRYPVLLLAGCHSDFHSSVYAGPYYSQPAKRSSCGRSVRWTARTKPYPYANLILDAARNSYGDIGRRAYGCGAVIESARIRNQWGLPFCTVSLAVATVTHRSGGSPRIKKNCALEPAGLQASKAPYFTIRKRDRYRCN
jgi:hypothetical protein